MKRNLLLPLAAFMALGALASPLTPQQALQRATASPEGKRLVKAGATPSLAYTARDARGESAVYVFNQPSGGFMLLSGDDIAMPMLGYADEGTFIPSEMPEQLRYWIGEYASQIEYARSLGAVTPRPSEVTMTFPSDWKSIAPLLTSRWDQEAPFSNFTPTINSRHCPTGCVATAMAQVMNYWEYPAKGTGKGTCKVLISQNNQEKKTLNLDEQPAFDWANMLDSYSGSYTQQQADAVANLMVQCGYATDMTYMATQSGTQTENVVNALINNFGYNSGLTMQQRMTYTASEWNELCYSQLAVGPIIYAGGSPEGNHCFVVDGYDGNGYFHVNWGWSGMCNGYYLLNAMNPTQQGTGGYYGGYNFIQSIVAGVQPTYSDPLPSVQSLSLTGSIQPLEGTSSTFQFKFVGGNVRLFNNSSISIQPRFGFEITNADGSGSPTYVELSQPSAATFGTFPPGSFVELSSSLTGRGRFETTLPDGRYKITVVIQNSLSSTKEWKPLIVSPENFNYFYVTKTGVSYAIEAMEPRNYSISEAAITSPLYYNNPFMLELTAENPYDTEITQSVTPYLYKDGKAQYSGENRLITLMPGEQTTISFSSSFSKLSGGSTPTSAKPIDFELVLLNEDNLTQYGTFGTVTMKRTTGTPKIQAKSISIVNAAEEGDVYGLDNFSDIELEVNVEVTGGFVASPLTAMIYEVDPSTSTLGSQIYEKDFDEMIFLEAGSEATVTTRLHPSDFDVTKTYQLVVYYQSGTRLVELGYVRFAASSGVDAAVAEGALALGYYGAVVTASAESGVAVIEAFDARGAKVAASGSDRLDLSELPRGIYIIRASDKAGNVKTIKIAR